MSRGGYQGNRGGDRDRSRDYGNNNNGPSHGGYQRDNRHGGAPQGGAPGGGYQRDNRYGGAPSGGYQGGQSSGYQGGAPSGGYQGGSSEGSGYQGGAPSGGYQGGEGGYQGRQGGGYPPRQDRGGDRGGFRGGGRGGDRGGFRGGGRGGDRGGFRGGGRGGFNNRDGRDNRRPQGRFNEVPLDQIPESPQDISTDHNGTTIIDPVEPMNCKFHGLNRFKIDRILQRAKPDDWICPKCFAHNFGFRDTCLDCSAAKTDDEGAKLFQELHEKFAWLRRHLPPHAPFPRYPPREEKVNDDNNNSSTTNDAEDVEAKDGDDKDDKEDGKEEYQQQEDEDYE